MGSKGRLLQIGAGVLIAAAVAALIVALSKNGDSSPDRSGGSVPEQRGNQSREEFENDPAVRAEFVEGYIIKGVADGEIETEAPALEVVDASCDPGPSQLFYCYAESLAPGGRPGPELYFLARYDPDTSDTPKVRQVGLDPAEFCSESIEVCLSTLGSRSSPPRFVGTRWPSSQGASIGLRSA